MERSIHNLYPFFSNIYINMTLYTYNTNDFISNLSLFLTTTCSYNYFCFTGCSISEPTIRDRAVIEMLVASMTNGGSPACWHLNCPPQHQGEAGWNSNDLDKINTSSTQDHHQELAFVW